MIAQAMGMEREDIKSAQVAGRLHSNKELSSGSNPASYTRNDDA
jgi:hypothetical protein